jgi:hypothetical protein
MEVDIYLDIDGVILFNGKPAKHADDFIKFIINRYPRSTYWLTTRCNGDAELTVSQIGRLFSLETVGLLKKIKATTWPIVKTQAIDFSRPFLWFDDKIGYADKENLLSHGALENLVLVDLENKPESLKHIIYDFPLPRELFK